MASGNTSSMMAITATSMTCSYCNAQLSSELDLANLTRSHSITCPSRDTLKTVKPESELERARIMRIYDEYQREIDESDGFDIVGDYRDKLPPGLWGILPADCSKEELAKDFNGHAQSAIDLYNIKMGTTFKLVEVEKANCSYMSSHITFTTREDENDEPIVFQASVDNTVEGEFVTLCRQKANPSEGYEEGDEDDEGEDEEEAEDCSEDEESSHSQ